MIMICDDLNTITPNKRCVHTVIYQLAYEVLETAAHERKGRIEHYMRHETLMYPSQGLQKEVGFPMGILFWPVARACSVPPWQMVTDVGISGTSRDMPVKACFRYYIATVWAVDQ
ncbi:hypothetical protein J6590_099741 [Homalodisca vitripennis]|nr:hypothetical protein J6590_099741 [Homalodisca vitripennis]